MQERINIPPAIETRKITKSYGHHVVLDSINLKVPVGESLVVLGPNGAGKTTFIKILATIIRASSGELFVDGLSPKKEPEEIRRRLGIITHDVFFYNNLTAQENLEFYCRLYDVENANHRIRELVDMVGMTTRLHDQVGIFSRGMQQKLSIARSLLHRPSIMLLDEPDTGLDQQALTTLWNVIKEQDGEKRTVITTTHNLDRAFDLGDRFFILSHGQVVKEIPRQGLDLTRLVDIYYENTRSQK